MKQIITTLFIAILALTVKAQDCPLPSIPFDAPSSVCQDDDAIFLTEILWGQSNQLNIYGDGIIQEQTNEGVMYYFDPSAISLNGDNQNTAVFTYGAVDTCQKWTEQQVRIIVEDCGCEAEIPDLPAGVCNTDDLILITNSKESDIYGDGVIYTNDGVFFDPSSDKLTANESTIVAGAIKSDCGVWTQFSTSIFVDNCTIDCFSADLPDFDREVCNTDGEITLLTVGDAFVTPSWTGVEGDGVYFVSDSSIGGGSFVFNASIVNEEGLYPIFFFGTNSCQEGVVDTAYIYVGFCQVLCEDPELPEVQKGICNTDDPIVLLAVGDLMVFPSWFSAQGPGVSYESEGQLFGEYIFDPSELDANESYQIIFNGRNSCGETVRKTTQIFVDKCDNECGKITELDVPKQACRSGNTVQLTETLDGGFEVWGDGVFWASQGTSDDGYYFDPSQVTGDVATINYQTYDNCQEWVTRTYTVAIENCNLTGIQDQEVNNLSIYPTHVEEGQTVIVNDLSVTQVLFANTLGQQYVMEVINGQLNVDQLPKGMYILKATTQLGQEQSARLIIE